MRTFRFFWDAHKWVGISIAAVLLITVGTGFLLLLKKQVAWIQPPTQLGAEGSLDQFISVDEAWKRVEALDHPDFRTPDDLDRFDVRPAKRVYKVRSRHNHSEIQIDAISGAVLSEEERVSDWLEELHDGSWIGKPFHDYVMPVVAAAVLFLIFSGFWLWLEPIVKRRRRRRAKQRKEAA